MKGVQIFHIYSYLESLIIAKGSFLSITISQILISPLTWIFFVFGTVLGSFFNVCIYRIPREIFWQSNRSICPHCGTQIPSWLNIPILSFLALRGKTRCCGEKIPRYYPWVELFSGLLVAYLYWRFPFFEKALLPLLKTDTNTLIRFTHALIFTSLLLICSVIDMQHMIIPDVISLPMVLLTPLVVLIHPDLTWQSALWGVLLGGGGVYAIAWLYLAVRGREGIGMGDAKLLAAIGGWLGCQALIPTLLFGSISGSCIGIGLMIGKRRMNFQQEIPFGPFLALGAALYLIAPIHWLEVLAKIHGLFFRSPAMP